MECDAVYIPPLLNLLYLLSCLPGGGTAMNIIKEDTVKSTELGTLWSETLLETLCDGLRNDWSGHALMQILRELNQKGVKMDKVIKRVRKKMGSEAAQVMLLKIKK
jgi:hypothetical protein